MFYWLNGVTEIELHYFIIDNIILSKSIRTEALTDAIE